MTPLSTTIGLRLLPAALAVVLALPAPAWAQQSGERISSRLGAYLAGRQAATARDMGEASRYLAYALAADPAALDLRRRTFQAHLGAGRIVDALALAASLTADEDVGNIARVTLAAGAAKRGDFAAAKELLEGLGDTGAERLLKPVLQAWVELGLGSVDKAVEALRPISGIEGLAPFQELHLALLYDAAGRNDDADRVYRAAFAPGRSPALRTTQGFSALLVRQDKRAEAIALWDKLLADSPDSSIAEFARQRLREGKQPARIAANATDGMAELLLNLSGALQQENAAAAALVYARLADYLRPGDPDTLYVIAGLLEGDDQNEAAVAAFAAVPRDSDLSWTARRSQAANLAQLKRAAEAVTLLEAMVAERPERWDALLLLGDLHRSEKQFSQAVNAYDRALERIGQPAERHWRLFYHRGIANERSKNWPRAEADFKRALSLKADEPYVLNYLAYTWVDRGENLEEAMRMLNVAVRAKPEDGAIVDSVGWAYYRLSQWDKALEFLERAIELNPEDPTINDHLGDIYWRVGRQAEARFQWSRALSLNPEAEDVPKIKEKLERGLPPIPAPAAKP